METIGLKTAINKMAKTEVWEQKDLPQPIPALKTPIQVKKQEKSIGGLWSKVGTKGTEYLTGEIEVGDQKISIKIFRNGFKETDKHPDWKIYKREPLEKLN